MNIVFSVNNSYAHILTTVLTSILENNPQTAFRFFIFTTDFSDENKRVIQKLKKRYAYFDVSYISPDVQMFKDVPTTIDYISKETYFRYMIADLLPDEDKALYLDADVIVNQSLEELYNTDITNFYAAAVKDLFIERSGYKSEIGFSDEDLYINAGAILFNLPKMRQDKISQKLLTLTAEYAEKIKYQDQDIINLAFRDKIKEVDSIYNFATANAKKEKNKRKSAVIIHYTGRIKPWHKESTHKLKKLWFKYDRIKQKIIKEPSGLLLLFNRFFKNLEN
ncbi:MAG: glycosyltransferase family 8 protein [Alphaproteobacteria bacterium]|nr:glycosyltransferase family 8 protein [Alphaproteobacteria bacterium]